MAKELLNRSEEGQQRSLQQRCIRTAVHRRRRGGYPRRTPLLSFQCLRLTTKILLRQGKGNIMHNYPQNQSYVGSSGQTLTTDVSMTLCSWQICHQTHVLCGRTTFVPNQIRYQISTVPTPTVAWTRA